MCSGPSGNCRALKIVGLSAFSNAKLNFISVWTEPDRAGPSRTGPDRAGPGRTDIGPSPGMNEHPIRAMKMIFTSIDTPFNFLQFEMVKSSK